MLLERQYISANDFLLIAEDPAYSDRLIELVEGEIIEMSKPTGLHGQITMLLAAKIFNHADEHCPGIITAAETGFVLERNPDGRDTVRGLDIAFIRGTRAPAALPDRLVAIAPDLAVEVISPGNKAADIHRKIRQLLAAGTRLVWIVYPDTQTVAVHRASGTITLEVGDTLSGGDVLPGFEMPLRALFPAAD